MKTSSVMELGKSRVKTSTVSNIATILEISSLEKKNKGFDYDIRVEDSIVTITKYNEENGDADDGYSISIDKLYRLSKKGGKRIED